jgi:polyisoprenoid-binding protein YceI
MSSRSAGQLIALAAIMSCASPAPSASDRPAPPSATATSPVTAQALPAGAVRLAVVPPRSRATIRVREQIAGVPAPSDAVLTTDAFSGALVLLPDGAFAPGSTIVVDLDTLESDSDLRDEWIKINTLQTRIHPRAEFTAARLADLPLPVPPDGEWSARLEGTMKIHGVERPLTWELQVTRLAGEVRARGSTSFRFGDYGMAVPANRLILSVVDLVRLEIDVVARDA